MEKQNDKQLNDINEQIEKLKEKEKFNWTERLSIKILITKARNALKRQKKEEQVTNKDKEKMITAILELGEIIDIDEDGKPITQADLNNMKGEELIELLEEILKEFKKVIWKKMKVKIKTGYWSNKEWQKQHEKTLFFLMAFFIGNTTYAIMTDNIILLICNLIPIAFITLLEISYNIWRKEEQNGKNQS